MLEDSRGNVWLRSAALARFTDGRFTNYYRPGRTRKALDWGNVVSALYEDRDGSIWVGTLDGIARFRDGRLHEERLLSERLRVASMKSVVIAPETSGSDGVGGRAVPAP